MSELQSVDHEHSVQQFTQVSMQPQASITGQPESDLIDITSISGDPVTLDKVSTIVPDTLPAMLPDTLSDTLPDSTSLEPPLIDTQPIQEPFIYTATTEPGYIDHSETVEGFSSIPKDRFRLVCSFFLH